MEQEREKGELSAYRGKFVKAAAVMVGLVLKLWFHATLGYKITTITNLMWVLKKVRFRIVD